MTHLTTYPRAGSGVGPVPDVSKQFDSLVIVDRATDLVTPFLTQLTYEGLLDEYFGIKNCKFGVGFGGFSLTSTLTFL